ncbi:MAG: ATP-binding protein [Acidobacteriota bacterium]|nr:ATP-binding protein [Acidobacteriota bacterium]
MIADEPQPEAIDLHVRAEQLRLSFSRLPLSLGLSFAVSAVFGWLLIPVFDHALLGRFFVSLWATLLLRLALWYGWRQRVAHPDDLGRWTLLFWLGTLVMSLAWSCGVLSLLVTSGPQQMTMLVITMLSVSAVASGILSTHFPSAAAFIVVTLLPIAVVMGTHADPLVRIGGLAVFTAAIILGGIARRLNLDVEDLIRAELHRSVAARDALRAKAAAEEANLAKSAFLANMSHELRTPLNAIIGYSEMLQEDAVAEGASASVADLQKIAGAGRQLLALITDVLDLSKIEAGRMDVHVEPFGGAAVVQAVLDTSQALARARSNALSASGLETLGTLHGDPTKLHQVLLNLVGNACKFTSHGRIHVAAARETGPAGDWLVVTVTDTGIGIAPEQMGRLFREFSQADASTTRRFGGTGLGLAISQRLCHLMGGAITVESHFGRGSVFTVRLPATVPQAIDAEATVRAPHRELAPAARALLASSTILVIDDDAAHREILTRMLSRAGGRVHSACSAAEGLHRVRSARPDAIVLDLMLPDENGWPLLQGLKADPDLAPIPVVVVSIIDDRPQSLALGAVDHLLKPVDPDRLVQAISRAVAARRESRTSDSILSPAARSSEEPFAAGVTRQVVHP